MTDDLVKQSIAELQDIVRCRCKPAFKDRGMHDPDCECDSADAVQVVADRIEELEAENGMLKELLSGFYASEDIEDLLSGWMIWWKLRGDSDG
jgi:hypothetical protein